MRTWPGIVIVAVLLSGCTNSREAAPANASPAAAIAPPQPADIPPAPDQPVSPREHAPDVARRDLDAIAGSGYVRVLVAPSRTYFETVDGRHHGRAVDAGVAIGKALSQQTARDIAVVFIETPEDQLIRDLLAGKGDVAANLLLTFARDDQVAFAPPIRTGIREFVVTGAGAPLVSLEDVGGKTIHVRKNSDHHASLLRLNEQLKKISHPAARIVTEDTIKTDEDLLDRVNSGSIPATIADDYIFDLWKKEFPNLTTNRDVAVSQDGILAWVTRKDAPKLIVFLKDFFSTHKLTF